jgi:lysozyme
MVDGGSAADLVEDAELLAIENQLVEHEGLRTRVYEDTTGHLTIGVGRNLSDQGISKAEALILLRNDIADARRELDENLPWWRGLSPIRQRVVLDLAFNLGIRGLLKFRRTLASIQAGNHTAAAGQLLESKYAQQVGVRALRLARMMAEDRDVALSEFSA